jgi:hypothetical protein
VLSVEIDAVLDLDMIVGFVLGLAAAAFEEQAGVFEELQMLFTPPNTPLAGSTLSFKTEGEGINNQIIIQFEAQIKHNPNGILYIYDFDLTKFQLGETALNIVFPDFSNIEIISLGDLFGV